MSLIDTNRSSPVGGSPSFLLAIHDDRVRAPELLLDPDAHGQAATDDFAAATWQLALASRDVAPGVQRCTVSATVTRGLARGVAAGLRWTFDNWSIANHVLIPGAVYAGNRFDSLRRPYPPPIRDVGQRADSSVLDIGDIPRLSDRPGRSHLDQTSLDAATPGVGIFLPDRREAFLLLTTQPASHGPIGFELIESDDRSRAELLVLAPGLLHPVPGEPATRIAIGDTASAHLHPENARPVDLAAGESVRFEFELHRFPCDDVHGLFARLFAYRTAMFPRCATPPAKLLPFSAAWDILERKHNDQNWNETRGLYQVGIPWDARPDSDQSAQFWQNGWCGGGIPTLAFLQEGQPASVARARRNLDFFFTKGVSHFGLFKAVMGPNGKWKGDGFGVGGEGSSAVLVRRQGDCLYFGLRQLQLLRDRGEVVPGTWTAAAYYRDHDLARGVTTGGPGDAVQAPDSESIFGLIESFIALFERTGDRGWRDAAVHACHQAASWAISYPYPFPPGSALAEMNIDARGAMIANAQNKCGVPGICTLSGQGVLRTFRATGDVRLLELLREIAHAIPQYLSREDRRIPTRITWGHPLRELPPGWICERVNITPSWPEPLGEQAAYSCWCEVAMMLTWADLPGIDWDTTANRVHVLDHVEAEPVDQGHALRITNPTAFPARVRVLQESENDRARPLPTNAAASWPVVTVPPRTSVPFRRSV